MLAVNAPVELGFVQIELPTTHYMVAGLVAQSLVQRLLGERVVLCVVEDAAVVVFHAGGQTGTGGTTEW